LIHPSNPSSIPAAINGRKQSEEEEIDDDEESALKVRLLDSFSINVLF